VSISTAASLILIVSPTFTIQVTISASVSPSPGSGSLYSLTATTALSAGSECEGSVDGVQDAVEVGQPLLLHPRGRVGGVEAADAEDRWLEGDHRVVVGDGLLDHPVAVDRVRDRDHLETGRVRELRLRRLAVVLDGADPATEGDADDHRHRHPAVAAEVQLRDLRHDLVVG